MNISEINAKIRELNRPNGSFYGFKTVTRPHMTKKNRTTKRPVDFDVTIHSTFSAMLGVNYENAVNNALEKLGRPADFVAQKPSGKHYVGESKWLMEADKTPGKFYVAMDRVGGKKSVIKINGIDATPEQVEDLKKNYFDKPSSNASVPLVTWRTYAIDSVVEIN